MTDPKRQALKTELARQLPQPLRDACLSAALEAYDDAKLRGLCDEGALEVAIEAARGHQFNVDSDSSDQDAGR